MIYCRQREESKRGGGCKKEASGESDGVRDREREGKSSRERWGEPGQKKKKKSVLKAGSQPRLNVY